MTTLSATTLYSLWMWVNLICFQTVSHAKTTVTLGVLAERSWFVDFPFGINRTIGIIDIGLSRAREIVGPDVDIHLVMRPGDCLTCTALPWGVIAADLYHNHRVDAFIGPGCTPAVQTVARMAAMWNLPIATYAGTDESLADKSEFQTLTRLSYNKNVFAKFYMAVFDWFGWTYIANIYDQVHYLNSLVGTSLQRSFEKAGVQSVPLPFHSGIGDLTTVLRNILTEASKVARVFVVCTHGDVFRQMMLLAEELGMTNGDYAFIIFFEFTGDPPIGDIHWYRGDHLDQRVKKAYEAVMVIRPRRPESVEFSEFEKDAKARALTLYNYTFEDDVEINVYNIAHYSAFVLYAIALNDTLAAGEDPRDGAAVVRHMWNRTFPGIGGTVAVNDNGDVDTDFTLLDIVDPAGGDFVVAGQYLGYRKRFELAEGVQIHWPNNKGPPANVPSCGFTGEKCTTFYMPPYAVVTLSLGTVILIVAAVGYFSYRRIKKTAQLYSLWWKVKWEEIAPAQRSSTILGSSRTNDMASTEAGAMFVGMYKGMQVHLKRVTMRAVNMDRDVLVELQQMRDLSCPNLTRFVGLCPDTPNVCIATEYCARGNLQDILQNDSMQLDWDFRTSLISDVVKGMLYLHNTPIGAHGQLNSRCCVIDSRFVLKITSIGLKSLWSQVSRKATHDYKLLWVAPEHVRRYPEKCSSKAGDVYSFGIILYEMCYRAEPYSEQLELLGLNALLSKIRQGGDKPVRPTITAIPGAPQLEELIIHCVLEDPDARPTFHGINKFLNTARKSNGSRNVLDVLLDRMSQYANNLEGLVEERTKAFLEEKRRSEALLYQVLPRSVANQLRVGQTVDPESFESVTIYFSDIVGFTAISADSSPFQVVDLLNDLYTCFDGIIDSFDVYKVETIGDAYMVVSGLPSRNGNEHVRQIARMSLCILDNIKRFKIRHKPGVPLQARIGVHTGFVCAGVVGRKMPRYCLFGDTVNTASRMESSGQAMKIHISRPTKDLLETFNQFHITPRGEVDIKGKGVMDTYWLVGETLPPLCPVSIC